MGLLDELWGWPTCNPPISSHAHIAAVLPLHVFMSCSPGRSASLVANQGCGPDGCACKQVLEAGHLNAIAFWFDLHLDDEISISTAPACIGLGGELIGESSRPAGASSANPVKTKGRAAMREGNAPNEEAEPQCRDGFMPAKVTCLPTHLQSRFWDISNCTGCND